MSKRSWKNRWTRSIAIILVMTLVLTMSNLATVLATITTDMKEAVPEDKIGLYLELDNAPWEDAVVVLHDFNNPYAVLEESSEAGLYIMSKSVYDAAVTEMTENKRLSSLAIAVYEDVGKPFMDAFINADLSKTNIYCSNLSFSEIDTVNQVGQIAEKQFYTVSVNGGDQKGASELPESKLVEAGESYYYTDAIPYTGGKVFKNWVIDSVNGNDGDTSRSNEIRIGAVNCPYNISAEWMNEDEVNSEYFLFDERNYKEIYYGVVEVNTEQQLIDAVTALNAQARYDSVTWNKDVPNIIKITSNITLTKDLNCKMGLILVPNGKTLTINKSFETASYGNRGRMTIQSGGKVVVGENGYLSFGTSLALQENAQLISSGNVFVGDYYATSLIRGLYNNGTITIKNNKSLMIYNGPADTSAYFNMSKGTINVQDKSACQIDLDRIAEIATDTRFGYPELFQGKGSFYNEGSINVDNSSSLDIEGKEKNSELMFPFINTGTINVTAGTMEDSYYTDKQIYIHDDAKVVNEGTITVEAVACKEEGIKVSYGGKLINTKSGTIALNNTANYGMVIGGDEENEMSPEKDKSIFTNDGAVTINNGTESIGMQIGRGGKCINNGSISITNSLSTSKVNCVGLSVVSELTNNGTINNGGSIAYSSDYYVREAFVENKGSMTGSGTTMYLYEFRAYVSNGKDRNYDSVDDCTYTINGYTYKKNDQLFYEGVYVPAGSMKISAEKAGTYAKKTYDFTTAASLEDYNNLDDIYVKIWLNTKVEDNHKTYRAFVIGGSCDYYYKADDYFDAKDTVTIKPSSYRNGYFFKNWVVESGNVTLSSTTDAVATFTMPNTDVKIRAIYEKYTGQYTGMIKSEADLFATAEAIYTYPFLHTTDGRTWSKLGQINIFKDITIRNPFEIYTEDKLVVKKGATLTLDIGADVTLIKELVIESDGKVVVQDDSKLTVDGGLDVQADANFLVCGGKVYYNGYSRGVSAFSNKGSIKLLNEKAYVEVRTKGDNYSTNTFLNDENAVINIEAGVFSTMGSSDAEELDKSALVNKGTINVSGSGYMTYHGAQEDNICFYNTSTGTINLEGAGSKGKLNEYYSGKTCFFLKEENHFYNDGTINIKNTGNDSSGIYIRGTNSYNNITQTVLENHGVINVENTQGTGIFLEGTDEVTATLLNEQGATINIKNGAHSMGVVASRAPSYNNTTTGTLIDNKGTITIANTLGKDSINSVGLCWRGELKNTGSITNNGSIGWPLEYIENTNDALLSTVTGNAITKGTGNTVYEYLITSNVKFDYENKLDISLILNGEEYTLPVEYALRLYLPENTSFTAKATYDGLDSNQATFTTYASSTAYLAGNRYITKLKFGKSPTGITLNKTALSLKVGEKATLSATIAPSDAYNKGIYMYSDDDSIATIDSTTGVVTAKAAGTTKITVSSNEDGSIRTSCTVTVIGNTPTYTVTFNANGGQVGTAKKVVTSGKTYGTLPTPTRTEYNFAGWYTAKSGGTKITSAAAVKITANITLYARWTVKKYRVTFNANSGKVSTAYKEVAKSQAYGTLPTPTRSGYTFAGWYTAATGGSKVSATTVFALSKPITLYARYSYKISFDKNGGSKVSSSSKTVYCLQKYGTLPTASRSGYLFTGWYTKKTGGSKITSASTVSNTKLTKLYARWSKVSVGKASIKSLSTKSKKITVKLNTVSGAKGYEITYATNSKFTSGKKTVTVTSTSKIISSLKKGKKYYVRVRAYKMDSAGKKVYGSYSSSKNIKVK